MADTDDPKVLGGLLALLVHDLRNPLSALHSNVDFLVSTLTNVDEDTRGALEDAAVSCDSLVSIVDNAELLAFNLQGMLERPSEPLSVGAVVSEVVTRQHALAESHGAQLAVDPSAMGSDVRIVAYREMYVRAFTNLLRNAIQHGSPGCVRVWIDHSEERVRLVVGDTGPALSEDCRIAAFTAAGQLTSKGKAGGRYGRGLGLLAARLAADSAGAVIQMVAPPPELSCAFALSAPMLQRRRTEQPRP
ncbi:sensor histidine kinase [Myxococcota bacterium]